MIKWHCRANSVFKSFFSQLLNLNYPHRSLWLALFSTDLKKKKLNRLQSKSLKQVLTLNTYFEVRHLRKITELRFKILNVKGHLELLLFKKSCWLRVLNLRWHWEFGNQNFYYTVALSVILNKWVLSFKIFRYRTA